MLLDIVKLFLGANLDRKALASTKVDNRARYAGALELERRLYESAIAAVDQTFAKESLVAAFLTSGAIVAFAGSLQAVAEMAAQVNASTMKWVVALFFIALVLLIVSTFRFASVLRGWKVDDISEAVKFLDNDPQPVTEDEVALKLIAEYRQARINHEELVKARLDYLFVALRWLGAATVVSFIAVLLAFWSVAESMPRL